MKLKHKSLLAGVISAAIVLPAATQISFANGNIEESIQGRTADYRTITGNDVNFRKGPGTNYSSIAKLNKGVKVEFLGTQGSWTKLKYNGIEGYVHSNYVSTASTNNSEETVKTTKVVTGSSVNLRKGPGTSYTVIKALSRGTEVGYISESNGWAKVNYNGTIGYMSASYLGNASDNSNNSTSKPSESNVEAVMSYAKKQLGKPYVWGAEGPDSFDCSGFTQYVFKNSVGVSIPRVSKDQSKHGQFVSRSELQRGDLVFFDTSGDGAVNHVGIYMGENQFIHASSGGGKVVISEMNSYYSPRYINARRVL